MATLEPYQSQRPQGHRIIRVEQDISAPTGDGDIYVCDNGSHWVLARGPYLTGQHWAVKRGNYVCETG